jgi:site-specific DNA recombinase
MKSATGTGSVRCAIYTRVSTDQGLDQDFNSLDAQYEAASAYIKSQAHAGWTLIRSRYDDGGYSGGSTDRPNLQQLLDDVRCRKVDVIVVYKVDRLTRSLADFAKLVELFDAHDVSFVSVTQQFNTTTSMGRLTLNVLLSFAQFEREVTSERIRDKIAASKRKGLWVGGPLPLGYELKDGKLTVVEHEAERVRMIFRRYLEVSGINELVRDLRTKNIRTKAKTPRRHHCARPELVPVSRYSGISKSSVVNELHKVLVPPRGLFASGKIVARCRRAVTWKICSVTASTGCRPSTLFRTFLER